MTESSVEQPPPRVAIACCGLGHVLRGYETFLRELFTHLRDRTPVVLFKGMGDGAPSERRVRCLRRTSLLGRAIARASSHKKAYELEGLTFGTALYRHLRRGEFDVAFVPDYRVARTLLWLRRKLPPARPLAVAFHNGGPYAPRKLGAIDLVQQLTLPVHEEAIAAGLANGRLLPIPVDVERFRPAVREDRTALVGLRREIGLREDSPVILCAAAHESFKRIDVLIEAVAALGAPSGSTPPALLVAGQDGERSAELRALAAARLGERGFLRRFDPDRMPLVHALADVFVLPSRKESLPVALLEAMASGTAVVSQDDAIRRWVTDGCGVLVDCGRPDSLRDALARLLADEGERARLGAAARARAVGAFSMPALIPGYLDFFETARRVVATPRPDLAATLETRAAT